MGPVLIRSDSFSLGENVDQTNLFLTRGVQVKSKNFKYQVSVFNEPNFQT